MTEHIQVQNSEAMVRVKNLKKYFQTPRGLLHAVDDVSFDIYRGETFGLVGESGCGKSTLGRAMIRLLEPTSGEVRFWGQDLVSLSASKMKEMRKRVQIVFQDPYSCLNPRLSVSELIAEPLIVNKVCGSHREMNEKIRKLMDRPAWRSAGGEPTLTNLPEGGARESASRDLWRSILSLSSSTNPSRRWTYAFRLRS